MKLLYSIVTILALLGYGEYLTAKAAQSEEQQEPHVITWSFVAKELKEPVITAKNLSDIIGVPGAAEMSVLRQQQEAKKVGGIMVFYEGRVTHSDVHGQIVLPLLEPTDELIFLVTERIKPKILHGNTVEGWVVSEKHPAEWFFMKRIASAKTFVWQSERMKKPPHEVPYSAIVICIDPEVVEIPVGSWPTAGGANLLVPNIYMTGILSRLPSSLNTIAINRFFRPAHPWFAYAPGRYVSVTT